MTMKLGLGSAQFGLDYGATNFRGRVPEAVVGAILERAVELGAIVLDTAPAYGDAEDVIGRTLPTGSQFRIVTKTSSGMEEASFERSLARLRLDSVYGLLVHEAADLMVPGADRLAAWLLRQQASGAARHVGVSVYEPEEAFALFDRYPFDLIQLPLNVLDRRMLTSGLLTRLHARGVEVHVRSVFLQGVLLDPDRARVARLPRAALQPWRAWLDRQRVTTVEAAVGFVAAACPDVTIICGVTSPQELTEVAEASRTPWGRIEDFMGLSQDASAWIDPRRW